MREYREICVMGKRIHIDIYDTGEGLNVLIEGGDKGHIGAIAAGISGELVSSVTFPSHKETEICENWARKLSAYYHGPVAVEAGVHYDYITKEQIRKLLAVLDGELEKIIESIGNRK